MRWLFRVASAWIWIGNALGAAFVLGTAVLYAFVLSEPLVSFTITQLSKNILQFFQPMILSCYAVLSGHGILALRSARLAIQQRWARSKRRAVAPSPGQTVPAKRGPTLSTIVAARQRLEATRTVQIHPLFFQLRARAKAHMKRLWRAWTRYNAEISRIFILWEVVNQTYQANKISRLVASVWINRLVVGVIVLNCWFAPVLYYTMRHFRKTHVRLARLLIDSGLDVVYNIGIPLSIFYPYYRDYYNNIAVFAPILYYMDTWYVNAISELRQVFVTSWVDLVSKVTGYLALLHRLYVVENVLRDARDPHHISRRETSNGRRVPRPQAQARTSIWLIVGLRSRLTKILDVILLLWGLSVLGVHIHSTVVAMRGNSAGCLLELRPWGSSRYTCGVLEVSCMKRHTTGRFPAIVDALDNVDPTMMQVLILSHCSELQVPPLIQQYSALVMLKVYNTTIQTWDTDAAFQENTHPMLQVLYFARVNMSAVPLGLLAQDFPPTVWDIEFCSTNLTTFPAASQFAWKNIVYLVIEANPLIAELPDAILKLPSVQFYQLSMNRLRSLPDWAFAGQELVLLSLNGNPLDSFPGHITSFKQMSNVSFRSTNMSGLPADWTTAEPPIDGLLVNVDAAGTPLCENLSTPDEPAKSTIVGFFSINCRDEFPSLLTFPLDQEDAWRAAS